MAVLKNLLVAGVAMPITGAAVKLRPAVSQGETISFGVNREACKQGEVGNCYAWALARALRPTLCGKELRDLMEALTRLSGLKTFLLCLSGRTEHDCQKIVRGICKGYLEAVSVEEAASAVAPKMKGNCALKAGSSSMRDPLVSFLNMGLAEGGGAVPGGVDAKKFFFECGSDGGDATEIFEMLPALAHSRDHPSGLRERLKNSETLSLHVDRGVRGVVCEKLYTWITQGLFTEEVKPFLRVKHAAVTDSDAIAKYMSDHWHAIKSDTAGRHGLTVCHQGRVAAHSVVVDEVTRIPNGGEPDSFRFTVLNSHGLTNAKYKLGLQDCTVLYHIWEEVSASEQPRSFRDKILSLNPGFKNVKLISGCGRTEHGEEVVPVPKKASYSSRACSLLSGMRVSRPCSLLSAKRLPWPSMPGRAKKQTNPGTFSHLDAGQESGAGRRPDSWRKQNGAKGKKY